MNLLKSFFRYIFNRTVYRFSRRAFRFIVSFFSIISILIITCSAASLSPPNDISVYGADIMTSHGSQITHNTLSQENTADVLGTSGIRLFFGGVKYNTNWYGLNLTVKFSSALVGKKGTMEFKCWNSNGAIDTCAGGGIFVPREYTYSYGNTVTQQYSFSFTGTIPSEVDLWFDCTIIGTQSNLNFYLYDFTFVEDEKIVSYPQPDPEISSGIDSIEQEESEIISGSQDDFDSEVSSGTNSILGFFNSAGQSLIFVKDMFNDLASNNIWLLITCSIMLAILPVLLGVFRGLGK